MRRQKQIHSEKVSDSFNIYAFAGSTTDISKRFTLGNGYMNWWDAQKDCRKSHTGLARVRNHLENEELRRMVADSQVWIGLRGDSWMWSDGSQPSFVPWKQNKPQFNGISDCSALSVTSNPPGITDWSCNDRLPFLCYSGTQFLCLYTLRHLILKLAFIMSNYENYKYTKP